MIERLSILWHYANARRRFMRWRDRASLEMWQETQVRQHLHRITQKSPYFRELADSLGPALWRDWPLANKAEMMTHFDRRNTAGITLEEAWQVAVEAERTRDFSRTVRGITVGLSSGTSGSRGVFLASKKERQLWAGTLLARVLRGTLLHVHRVALFLRADSPLYQTVGSKRFRFEFFDMIKPVEEHLPRLRELRPTILAAPPSVLSRLAEIPDVYQLLAPPAILCSVADVLEEVDRTRIESAFRHPVGQIYQATEGFLAASCPHGRLHWNEDALVVQKDWLNPERTRYAPIITDFRRFTQPIIRHRLDDVIVEDDGPPCPCGSVFGTLRSIEGRCDDILYLPRVAGQGSVTIFPDFVRRAVVLAIPVGVDYTITQIAPLLWEAAFSAPCNLASVRREIHNYCRSLGAQAPQFRPAAWQPADPTAKRRRIRRHIAAPSPA